MGLSPVLLLVSLFVVSFVGCFDSRKKPVEVAYRPNAAGNAIDSAGPRGETATDSGGFNHASDADSAIASAGSSGNGGEAVADGSDPTAGTKGSIDPVDSAAVGGSEDGSVAEGGLAPEGGSTDSEIGVDTCCPDGDCLCYGPDPTGLTSDDGPYNTDTYNIPAGTVYYPIDAEPPFAAVAVCGGFGSTGPAMPRWGEFYASHGIVAILAYTSGMDMPETISRKLLTAIDELKGENANISSPLYEKLSNRYAVNGYSMGGGGALIAAGADPSLLASVGFAAWSPPGDGIEVASLLFCGDGDLVAPCSMSLSAYDAIPGSTPKMMISVPEATHFSWYAPTDAAGGLSGQYTLAFLKVFLLGDQRWRPFLLTQPDNISDWRTNIE